MKAVIVVILALAPFAVAQNQLKTILEQVDIEKFLKNDRILVNYLKCLLDEGPCTAEARYIKETMKDFHIEFAKTAVLCDTCTDREKDVVKRVTIKVKDMHQDMFERLLLKYAPEKRLSDAVYKFIEE